MTDVNIMVRESRFSPIAPLSNHVVDDSPVISPLIVSGEFLPDSTLDIEAQSETLLRQYGIEVPEKAVYFDTPRNETHEQILGKSRLMSLESRQSVDKISAKMASAPLLTEDGRPHITAIEDVIKNINSNYQKNFGEITKSATKFMESLNFALGKMSKNLEAGKNGEIKLYKGKIFDDLNISMKDYYLNGKFSSSKEGDGNVFEVGYINILDKIYTGSPPTFNVSENQLVENMKPMSSFEYSKESLDFWNKKLEGQGFIVVKKDDRINIYPDMAPLKKIYTTVRSLSGEWYGEVSVSSQIFQSLQTGIDSQKNAVNNTISRLLETFRQDNSHFETLTQLLIQLYKDLFQYNMGFASV